MDGWTAKAWDEAGYNKGSLESSDKAIGSNSYCGVEGVAESSVSVYSVVESYKPRLSSSRYFGCYTTYCNPSTGDDGDASVGESWDVDLDSASDASAGVVLVVNWSLDVVADSCVSSVGGWDDWVVGKNSDVRGLYESGEVSPGEGASGWGCPADAFSVAVLSASGPSYSTDPVATEAGVDPYGAYYWSPDAGNSCYGSYWDEEAASCGWASSCNGECSAPAPPAYGLCLRRSPTRSET